MAYSGLMPKKKLKDIDLLDVGSNFLTGAGSLIEGVGAYQAGQSQELQLEERAKRTEAAATIAAGEVRKDGDRVASDAVAANAASGGAMDAAMIERMARIESDFDYNVLSTLYQGRVAAETDRYAAKVAKRRGKTGLAVGAARSIPSFISGANKVWDF